MRESSDVEEEENNECSNIKDLEFRVAHNLNHLQVCVYIYINFNINCCNSL